MGYFTVRGKRISNTLASESSGMLLRALFAGTLYPQTWYYTVLFRNAQGFDTINPTANPTLVLLGTPEPTIDSLAQDLNGGTDTFLSRNGSWYEAVGERTVVGAPTIGLDGDFPELTFPDTEISLPNTGVETDGILTATPGYDLWIALVNTSDVGDNTCQMFAMFQATFSAADYLVQTPIGIRYTFQLQG